MRIDLSPLRHGYLMPGMLAAFVALGACSSKDAATTDTMSVNPAASAADTSGMGTSVNADAAPSAAAAQLTDANIAALVDEVNMGDSALAVAALPKLTSQGAKSFAKMMMGEHHAIHVQGLQVEKAQNITPVLPTPDPFKPAVEAEQAALASMASGPAYDSTYIAHEAGIHQAVLDWAGKQTVQNAAYQEYLKSAGPIYQKHLDRALALQKSMSGAMK